MEEPDSVYVVDRKLLIHYMNINEKRVEEKLMRAVEENIDIDWPILQQCFREDADRKWANGEGSDHEDMIDIAENKAIEAFDTMRRATRGLRWLFKNGSPFATTFSDLEKLKGENLERHNDVEDLHKAVIEKQAILSQVSSSGVVGVEGMETLLFMSNKKACGTIPERIFAKYPCTSVFNFKIAYFIWNGLGRAPPRWKDLKTVAFMTVISKRTSDDGYLNFNLMEKGEDGKYSLARSVVSELWETQDENTHKTFDSMPHNKLSMRDLGNRPTFDEAIDDIQDWLLLMASEKSGKTLAAMPIPLCVDKDGIMYTETWYSMWNTMIEDIEYYMPREAEEEDGETRNRKGFVAEFCPVCLENFKTSDGDGDGDGTGSDENATGPDMHFTGCDHAICASCFERCEKVAGNGSKSSKAGKAYRRCPICRAETYLRSLRSSTEFLKWYKMMRDKEEVREFSEQQLAPIVALLDTCHGCVNVDGAAGTGKSELVGLMTQYDLYLRKKYKYSASIVARAMFIAPTGTAAKNMEKRLPRNEFQVATIHSWALSLYHHVQTKSKYGDGERKNNTIKLAVPFLFIDEAAMVGTWIMSCVLRLARMTGIERIVLLGDRYQLPPVKAIGSLFASCCLCKNKRISNRVFRLTHCYRTGVEGINKMLKSLRRVMGLLENVGLAKAKAMRSKLLQETDFMCHDENHSIDLIKVEGNATSRQHILLNEVQDILRQFAEEKTRSGDSSALSDTTCVITDKRKGSALLGLQFLGKQTIENCTTDYNKMLEFLNPTRKRMRKKKTKAKRKRNGDIVSYFEGGDGGHQHHHNTDEPVSVDRLVAGDCVMSTVNVRIDNNNHLPKELVLSNGSQGEVVSITYGEGLKGAKGYLKDVEKMDVVFEGQHFKYPVSEWYPSSPFAVHTSSHIATEINLRNQEALSKMFKDLVIGSVQTVHKYQGSQKENVVVVMSGGGGGSKGGESAGGSDNFHTLNMLYTAVSRAQHRIRLILDEVTLRHFMETPTLAPQDLVLINRLNNMQ